MGGGGRGGLEYKKNKNGGGGGDCRDRGPKDVYIIPREVCSPDNKEKGKIMLAK